MENGEGIVEGDQTKDDEDVCDEEEDCFSVKSVSFTLDDTSKSRLILNLESVPEMPPQLRSRLNDPGPSFQRQGIHNPEVESREDDRHESAGKGQPNYELICKAPDAR